MKDYLEEVLSNRIELLRSNKSLSYEDALKFRSIIDLKRHLTKNETDTLGYGGIDDLAAYMQRKFNIDVNSEPSLASCERSKLQEKFDYPQSGNHQSYI